MWASQLDDHHSVGNGVRRWQVTNTDEGGVLEFPKVKARSSLQFVRDLKDRRP